MSEREIDHGWLWGFAIIAIQITVVAVFLALLLTIPSQTSDGSGPVLRAALAAGWKPSPPPRRPQ